MNMIASKTQEWRRNTHYEQVNFANHINEKITSQKAEVVIYRSKVMQHTAFLKSFEGSKSGICDILETYRNKFPGVRYIIYEGKNRELNDIMTLHKAGFRTEGYTDLVDFIKSVTQTTKIYWKRT
ncbi:hypothetical protein BK126_26275 [Paenibacillus sp. FSL H7-0326]|uniref:hypothetical protein n=1 Tax=Paenibacillus sp. FSL H7-0326 TaxID=1921144 RepID=UPI00096D9FEF|nr:hypothetical protein [Paenibacillus sp. FSL H7-0326]OMC63702.1 hypothetical protein BK126_26275 [Paenibacillus sp. FSL H7-0326]